MIVSPSIGTRSQIKPGRLFTFNLREPGDVAITIYDVAGRTVRNIELQDCNLGFSTIEWDGRNNENEVVSTGVYFVVIEDVVSKLPHGTARFTSLQDAIKSGMPLRSALEFVGMGEKYGGYKDDPVLVSCIETQLAGSATWEQATQFCLLQRDIAPDPRYSLTQSPMDENGTVEAGIFDNKILLYSLLALGGLLVYKKFIKKDEG